MMTQTRWRVACAITTGCAALMAWFGVDPSFLPASLLYYVAYWGVFLVLIIVSVFIAILDIRYIRLQYALGQRELFRQTLGDAEFRQAIIAAQRKKADASQQPESRDKQPG
jgi:hypothetical protein